MDAQRFRGSWRVIARGLPALLLLAWSIRLALPTDEGGAAAWASLVASFDAPAGEIALWGALGTTFFGLTLATAAMRFQVLLRAAGIETSLGRALHVILVGHFFNTVLPGGVVGDVWRVVDGHEETRRGPAVLGVVAVERVLGLQALGVVSLCAAPFASGDVLETSLFAPVVAAAAVCAFGPLLLLWPAFARGMLRAAERGSKRFPRVQKILFEVSVGLAQLRRDRSRLLFAVAASLVCQGLPVVGVWALAQPLSGDVHAIWFAIIVPFVTLMSMLPISLGGAGVRELLFVSLFGRVGLQASAGLALGLTTGLVNLAWAAVGLALFAMGRTSRNEPGRWRVGR